MFTRKIIVGLLSLTIWGGTYLLVNASGNSLDVLNLKDDKMTEWGSFADDRPGKKTTISYSKVETPDKGMALKINYTMDKDSWCGVYRHSLKQRWLGAKTLKIKIKGNDGSTVMVSFLDRNKVSYVSKINLDGKWKVFDLPLNKFKLNPYFQPPEAMKGEPLNLKLIHQLQFEPQTPGKGVIYIESIQAEGVIPNIQKIATGVSGKSTRGEIVFENFEKGKLTGDFKYFDKSSNADIKYFVKKRNNPKKRSNQYYLSISYNSGKGDYGCGLGFNSSNQKEEKIFNVTGLTKLGFIMKAPKKLKFRFSISEDKEKDGEKWTSPWLYGIDRWKGYSVKLSDFEKNIHVGNQDGNERLDTAYISNIDFEIDTKQDEGKVLIDDIYFK